VNFDFQNNFGVSLGEIKIDIKKKYKEKFSIRLYNRTINKTGPKTLYHSAKHTSSLDLALGAYQNFIKKNKKFQTKNIHNLIFVTETNKFDFPGNSFLFASALNLNPKIGLYDLNFGCTGFVEALDLAYNLHGNSLIVCAETYSKHMRVFNRSTSSLFSDGGSIFFLDKNKVKIIDTFRFFKKNSFNDLFSKEKKLFMDGKKVFEFVNTEVVSLLFSILRKKKNIKLLFNHQASLAVENLIKNKLSKFDLIIPSNIKKIGNTVSSSIPHLMNEYLKKNKIKKNTEILLCGFGVGLSVTAVILKVLK